MPVDGKKIRSLRKAKGWTLRDLAERVGSSHVHVQGIEVEREKASIAFLDELARVLGVRTADLFIDEPGLVSVQPIPLLNRVPVDDPKEYTGRNYPSEWVNDYIPCPEDLKDPGAFALKVADASMRPRFKEGDMLLVSPQTGLKDDIAVVYRLKDGDCGVKNYRQGQGGEVILFPENPEASGLQVFKAADFVFISPVVKALRNEY